MAYRLAETHSLTIEASTSPCAHLCRYCFIGDREGKFPINRWMAFVDRFYIWNKQSGPDGLQIHSGFPGPSYNFDLETFIMLSRWHKRITGNGLKGIPLGGLKKRSKTEMRHWLAERQSVGVERVHASLVGCGAVHDRWNGRHGDFEFLMETFRTAAELGLNHSQTLYLTKSSLPHLDRLNALLDNLPTPSGHRHYRPFYYSGHGGHLDQERLTEDDLNALPLSAREELEKADFKLRSEREWISIMRTEEEEPRSLLLRLALRKHNMDQLEKIPCGALFAKLESRARADLAKVPDLAELCEHYADPKGTRLYTIVDLRRLLVERFLEDHPIAIDRSLLHYHLGRSRKPPRVWEIEPAEQHD